MLMKWVGGENLLLGVRPLEGQEHKASKGKAGDSGSCGMPAVDQYTSQICKSPHAVAFHHISSRQMQHDLACAQCLCL